MNELIQVHCDDRQTVSVRELYEKLEIKERFSIWWDRCLKTFGLTEEESYRRQTYTNANNQEFDDYEIPIDIGKHICMISGSPKAHAIRQYFIQLEAAWNTPEMVMARALKMADKQISQLTAQNTQLQEHLKIAAPKEKFADACMASADRVKVGDVAKVASKNGLVIGQNRLFKLLRQWGVLDGDNIPYQRFIDRGYFEVRERHIDTREGVMLKFTSYVTPKGQIYIINRLHGKAE